VIWEAVFRSGIFPGSLIPSPLGVMNELATGFYEGSFTTSILISMKRITMGYLISLPVGLGLGLLTGRVPYMEDNVSPLLLGLQNLPNICWVPLAIFWFGHSEATILFVIILGSVFSLSLATISGIKNVPPIYTRLAKTMGARGFVYDTTVLIPAALPSIIGGMKQGWSFAWRGLLAAELLSPKNGLGYILKVGQQTGDMDQFIAVMIIIIIIGILVDKFVFGKLEESVRCRWGLTGA